MTCEKAYYSTHLCRESCKKSGEDAVLCDKRVHIWFPDCKKCSNSSSFILLSLNFEYCEDCAKRFHPKRIKYYKLAKKIYIKFSKLIKNSNKDVSWLSSRYAQKINNLDKLFKIYVH